jgi:hypothetical protein
MKNIYVARSQTIIFFFKDKVWKYMSHDKIFNLIVAGIKGQGFWFKLLTMMFMVISHLNELHATSYLAEMPDYM